MSEQLPYAAGAARSIVLDRELGQVRVRLRVWVRIRVRVRVRVSSIFLDRELGLTLVLTPT